MPKIKIEGYKEAKAILDQLTNNLQKKILLSTLRSSARPMLQSAQNKVPVRSGKLKKMLKIVRFRNKYLPKSEVDIAIKHVFSRGKKGKENEYYGKFIHEGTVDPRTSRKKGKLLVFKNQQGETVFAKSVKGIKPHPYIEQAYTENENRVVTSFGDELGKAVSKFVNKNFKPIIK